MTRSVLRGLAVALMLAFGSTAAAKGKNPPSFIRGPVLKTVSP